MNVSDVRENQLCTVLDLMVALSLFYVFSCKEEIREEIRVNPSGKYELALETLANGELPDGDAPNMPTIMFAEDVLEDVKREKSNSTT